jgi:hypothetical protein
MPAEPRTLHILNLGAGTQSTALKVMDSLVHHSGRRADVEAWLGEPYTIPPLDYAVFADTQWEPSRVYDNVARLAEHFAGCPILVRTRGSLRDDLLNGFPRKSRAGEDVLGHKSIPAFVLKPDGSQGLMGRHCTPSYKVEVVEEAVKREIVGVEKRHRFPEGVVVFQYFGLSFDEPGRCARTRARVLKAGWSTPVFPLYEMVLTKRDCKVFNAAFVPWPVGESSCIGCPLHDNVIWRTQRDESPEEWAAACDFDDAMRAPGSACARGLDGVPYLHRSMVPLREAPIDDPDPPGQIGWALECEGLCGN